ncbi:MAG: UbiA-like polyprenyltransferase [Tenuifilaceae bacterium]|jgi:4-hydroxybenzoate polyprenyltransferase|nr:UbiA-like polyprenyltransferase [Tenuifilaceae bacterium]
MNKHKKVAFKDYLSLVKFSHTIFALPFAIIGFFLSIYLTDHTFSWVVFVKVILCMIFARNAAVSFNRVTDRFIDKRNPRNSNREIPSGKIHPRDAFIFSMINALLFIVTTFFINKMVFYLSPIVLIVLLGYSYTKRFTVLCHFVLGLGLSLAPIGAYLAVTGQWHVVPLLFSLIVFLWVGGFDILYSIQDEAFDKEESIKTVPAVFGKRKSRVISIVLHIAVLLLVLKVGYILDSGIFYWAGAVAFISLLITQQLIIKPSSAKSVNFAYATLNGLASLLFAAFNITSYYF